MLPEELKHRTVPAARYLMISCEHGGNRIPLPWQHLFRDCQTLLESHRGFDPGALVMAKALARSFRAPLLSATVSRLLVDLNRSIGHPDLHAQSIRALPAATRQQILGKHYQPYRKEALRRAQKIVSTHGRVIHVSCHSFTGNLDGVQRHADVGLLYDPARTAERDLCARWKSALRTSSPGLEVRRNYPYQGRNDGLTTTLRQQLPHDRYLGIELELNQKHVAAPENHWPALRAAIITTLETALKDLDT